MHRGKVEVIISLCLGNEMLIIHGESDAVTTDMWNGKRVWIAGKGVSFDVVQTYMDSCIMVVDTVDDLWLDMDGIYVINQGKVVQSGTHEVLLKEKGLYAELYKAQFED